MWSRVAVTSSLSGIGILCALFGIPACDSTKYERPVDVERMPGAPPQPTFISRVNYLEWMESQTCDECDGRTASLYATLWRTPEDGGSVPRPRSGIEEKMRALVGRPWSAKDHTEVRGYLEAIRSSVKGFVEASDAECFCFTFDRRDLGGAELYVPSTTASRFLVLSMLLDSWEGNDPDTERMISAWRTGFRHSKHLLDTGVMVLRLQGHRLRRDVLRSIRASFQANLLNLDDLRAVELLLEEYEEDDAGLPLTVRLGWADALRRVQIFFPQGKLNQELAEQYVLLSPRGGRRDVRGNCGGFTPAELGLKIDIRYSTLVHLVTGTVTGATVREWERVEREHADAVGKRGFFGLVFFPSMAMWLRDEVHMQSEYRATMLALCATRFRIEHGRWPSDMTEFAPASGDMNNDPLSARPFVYRAVAVAARPVDEREMPTLYSLGEDGTDDGGQTCRGASYGLRPPEHCDIVFFGGTDGLK